MANAFDSGFEFGAKVGGALGGAQRKSAYGKAYQEGGWKGLGEFAGDTGDLDTASQAQTQVVSQEKQALEKIQRTSKVLANVWRGALASLPYEQRKARIQELKPRLLEYQIPEDKIDSVDPTDEFGQNLLAMDGQYSKYSEVKEGADGRLLGRVGDSWEIMPGQPEKAPSAPAGYRPSADGTGLEFIPGGPGDPAQAGSLADARRVTVNVGGNPKPPAGYRYNVDDNLEAIPGGPAEIKENAAREKIAVQKRKADLTVQGMRATSENLLRAVEEAKTLSKGWLNTGLGSAVTANVGGTDALNLARTIETIKANLGFDKLAEMRAASPTGGALGAVTERELSFLQNTVASLDQSQSDEQLRKNLDIVADHIRSSLRRIQDAYDTDGYNEPSAAPVGASPPQREDPLGIR